MKILEEKKLKGLKKEFVVQIPFSDLDDLKQKKLIEISQKVKIEVLDLAKFQLVMLKNYMAMKQLLR